MRVLILFFLTFLGLSGCVNEKPKPNAAAVVQKPNLSKTYNPWLKGSWVLNQYIRDLGQTFSPLKSAQLLKGVCAMTMNEATNADSIRVDASYNNHEGLTFTTYFLAGQLPTQLKTSLSDDLNDKNSFYELGVSSSDSSLQLIRIANDNHVLESQNFVKVKGNEKNIDPSSALQYMVNKIIILGNYSLKVNNGAPTKVTFNDDGTVTGIPKFKTYYINTDFLGDVEQKYDEIIFDLDLPTKQTYIFSCNGTYLDVMTTKGNEDDGTLAPAKIKFHFVKQ